MIPQLKSTRLYLALAAVYAIWGSTFLVVSFAIETIPPLLMTGVRFAIAGVVLFTALRIKGRPMPTRKQWRNAFFIGSLMMGGGQGLVAFGEQWIGTGLASLLIAAVPFWMVVFAGFVERLPSRFEVIGLIFGVIGVLLLNMDGDMWVEPAGAIAMIASPLLWALGSILSRHADLPGGSMNTATMLLCASFVMLAMGFLGGERFTETPSAISLAAMLYLSVFASIVAFGSYVYLLANASPMMATSYAYVNPGVALALGTVVRGETISALAGVAAVFIVAAIMAISIGNAREMQKKAAG